MVAALRTLAGRRVDPGDELPDTFVDAVRVYAGLYLVVGRRCPEVGEEVSNGREKPSLEVRVGRNQQVLCRHEFSDLSRE